MFPIWFSSLVLVPIVKLLKATLSTPSVFGDRGSGFLATKALRSQADAEAPIGLPKSTALRR